MKWIGLLVGIRRSSVGSFASSALSSSRTLSKPPLPPRGLLTRSLGFFWFLLALVLILPWTLSLRAEEKASEPCATVLRKSRKGNQKGGGQGIRKAKESPPEPPVLKSEKKSSPGEEALGDRLLRYAIFGEDGQIKNSLIGLDTSIAMIFFEEISGLSNRLLDLLVRLAEAPERMTQAQLRARIDIEYAGTVKSLGSRLVDFMGRFQLSDRTDISPDNKSVAWICSKIHTACWVGKDDLKTFLGRAIGRHLEILSLPGSHLSVEELFHRKGKMPSDLALLDSLVKRMREIPRQRINFLKEIPLAEVYDSAQNERSQLAQDRQRQLDDMEFRIKKFVATGQVKALGISGDGEDRPSVEGP